VIATKSLCPTCYKEITGLVSYNQDSVWMLKDCPEHGHFRAKIEDSIPWHLICRKDYRNNIYNGYMIDVTDVCDLGCKYCYRPLNDAGHRPVKELVIEAKSYRTFVPFILSGGEPTMHPDMPVIIEELVKLGPVSLLTNGVRLCDKEYLDALIKSGISTDGKYLNIVLSIHKESGGKDLEFLGLCRDNGLKVASAIFVIDDIEEIDGIVETYRAFKDALASVRIRSAARIWNEDKPDGKIFVSSIINYLAGKGQIEIMADALHNNKTSYGNVLFEKELTFYPSCWYDAANIDLNDIACPPYYKAKDGSVNNIVTSFLVNERIANANN